jgi:hypothetical protein
VSLPLPAASPATAAVSVAALAGIALMFAGMPAAPLGRAVALGMRVGRRGFAGLGMGRLRGTRRRNRIAQLRQDFLQHNR